MGFQDPYVGWEHWAALAGHRARLRGRLAAAGGCFRGGHGWGWWRCGRCWRSRRFKAGFVRHDPAHANIFFASLLGGLVAFGWAPHRRRTAWLLGAMFALALFASAAQGPGRPDPPGARASNLVDQAQLLADGDRDAHSAIAAARAASGSQGAARRALPTASARHGPRRAARRRPAVGAGPALAAAAGLPDLLRLHRRPRRAQRRHGARSRRARLRAARGRPTTFRRPQPAVRRRPRRCARSLCHFRAPVRRARPLDPARAAPRRAAARERPLKTVEAKLGVPAPVPAAPDAPARSFVRIDGIERDGPRAAARGALPRAASARSRSTAAAPTALVPGTAERRPRPARPGARRTTPAVRLDQATNTIDDRQVRRAAATVRLRFFSMPIR